VRTVNRNIVATSDRFIIGASSRQMETLVKDCGLTDTQYSERVSVDVMSSSADESFVRFQCKHPPKYFYVD
jgi:hypothetical protein